MAPHVSTAVLHSISRWSSRTTLPLFRKFKFSLNRIPFRYHKMKKTTQLAQQIIKAIGCANGLAGRQLGCENAVEVIKASPYFADVQNKIPLKWGKIINEVNTGRQASALAGVTQTCRQLAHETRQAIENKDELLVSHSINPKIWVSCFQVFGGDHSCAIGTWSGIATALRPVGDIGLIWVDAHMVRLGLL